MAYQLLAFLPAYLANSPLGLFLLISIIFMLVACLTIYLLSLILP